jgi:hypothetical protein
MLEVTIIDIYKCLRDRSELTTVFQPGSGWYTGWLIDSNGWSTSPRYADQNGFVPDGYDYPVTSTERLMAAREILEGIRNRGEDNPVFLRNDG